MKEATPWRMPPPVLGRCENSGLGASHPGIARSVRYMQKHYHEGIGVDDLAKVAAMSVRNFHYAFSHQVGRTPGAELHRLRLQKAARLLAGSDKKLAAIAVECGYQSGNSLWVAVKQATGLSPKEYRSRYFISSSPQECQPLPPLTAGRAA